MTDTANSKSCAHYARQYMVCESIAQGPVSTLPCTFIAGENTNISVRYNKPPTPRIPTLARVGKGKKKHTVSYGPTMLAATSNDPLQDTPHYLSTPGINLNDFKAQSLANYLEL
ncbi:hypothetical protein N7517_008029 [Penicillium concentricum]|uniref:Uncharacterized protein n=1 Tax=Penicillium concentricum TaxID=293559 RepID=A0A9W9RWK0_9EURO|nr:uncharacterized protein N7517_008029 [Penicillium concentricum]KAJ5365143.1 hypothetical protein N7517_008029 [Penicillium concentricum]